MNGPQNLSKSLILRAKPLVIAHRGFAQECEENTLSSFQKAYDVGVRYMETDVHSSSDGTAVIFHDNSLKRLTGLNTRVDSLTWADISAVELSDGSRIPTLDQAFEQFPNCVFNIDVKNENSIEHMKHFIKTSVL